MNSLLLKIFLCQQFPLWQRGVYPAFARRIKNLAKPPFGKIMAIKIGGFADFVVSALQRRNTFFQSGNCYFCVKQKSRSRRTPRATNCEF